MCAGATSWERSAASAAGRRRVSCSSSHQDVLRIRDRTTEATYRPRLHPFPHRPRPSWRRMTVANCSRCAARFRPPASARSRCLRRAPCCTASATRSDRAPDALRAGQASRRATRAEQLPPDDADDRAFTEEPPAKPEEQERRPTRIGVRSRRPCCKTEKGPDEEEDRKENEPRSPWAERNDQAIANLLHSQVGRRRRRNAHLDPTAGPNAALVDNRPFEGR